MVDMSLILSKYIPLIIAVATPSFIFILSLMIVLKYRLPKIEGDIKTIMEEAKKEAKDAKDNPVVYVDKCGSNRIECQNLLHEKINKVVSEVSKLPTKDDLNVLSVRIGNTERSVAEINAKFNTFINESDRAEMRLLVNKLLIKLSEFKIGKNEQ